MDVALLSLHPQMPLDGADGCSVQLRALASALARAGHRVRAVSRGAPGAAGSSEGGVDHIKVGSDRVDAVAEVLAGLGPGIVIESLHAPLAAGAVAADRLGVPHIYLVDGIRAGHDRPDTPGTDSGMEAAFTVSQGAIAFSGEAAAWVREHAPRHYPVRLTTCGVDPALLAGPCESARARARAVLRDRPGLRIGFAGSLSPAHDLELLARASASALASGPVQLVLLGDGPSRNPLIRLAIGLGLSVAVLGRVPHEAVGAHLALCHVVAVPCADPEGCASPTKLIEAMAVGRPLVASATRLARQHVRDGFDGLLAPVGDRAAFASHLTRLAASPAHRERLGANAVQSARRRRTWDAVAADILDFGLACAERLAD